MSDILKKSKKIKTIVRSLDERGSIVSLVNFKLNNVSIITSNKNTIRSNHYHKKDWHYIYVLEGEINYFYKNLVGNKIFYKKIKKSEIIFTPPKEIHATHFPVKTKLLVLSKNKRNKTIYEKDTVRVDFIHHRNINKYLSAKKI